MKIAGRRGRANVATCSSVCQSAHAVTWRACSRSLSWRSSRRSTCPWRRRNNETAVAITAVLDEIRAGSKSTGRVCREAPTRLSHRMRLFPPRAGALSCQSMSCHFFSTSLGTAYRARVSGRGTARHRALAPVSASTARGTVPRPTHSAFRERSCLGSGPQSVTLSRARPRDPANLARPASDTT